ncbi:MAG: AraC family transcriptional regulator, partial [Candidatus Sumerlaeota bacterium]|nr:AraC family transcriptional regulator [Candidatus Sumerlaeota bacterium]
MSRLEPVYKDHGAVYHIDNCEPQLQAAAHGKIHLVCLGRGSYPGKRLGKHELPGLNTIGYWDAIGEQQWSMEVHRNEGIEFTFLETGALSLLVDGRLHEMRPNDLTITRPWQPHRQGDPCVKPGRLHWALIDVGVRRPHQAWHWPAWVALSKDDLKNLTTLLRATERPIWRGAANLRDCWRRIAHAVENGADELRASRLIIYLNEMLLMTLELLRARKPAPNDYLSSTERTVQMFLDALTADPAALAHPWSVEEMAAHCHLSITAFTSLCRRLTNEAPMHFLNHCRMTLAARLLKEQPCLSVPEVARACGYRSREYFAQAFHRIYGRPPREFRGSGIEIRGSGIGDRESGIGNRAKVRKDSKDPMDYKDPKLAKIPKTIDD